MPNYFRDKLKIISNLVSNFISTKHKQLWKLNLSCPCGPVEMNFLNKGPLFTFLEMNLDQFDF